MIRASRLALAWPLALLTCVLLAAPLSGQAAGEGRSVRDGVYTEAQSERGETGFRHNCASCHTLDEFTGPGFWRRWTGLPVGNLFDLVRNEMPEDFPGGLTARQYADILAFFLKQNGLPPGASDLPASRASLAAIVMEAPPSPSGGGAGDGSPDFRAAHGAPAGTGFPCWNGWTGGCARWAARTTPAKPLRR